MAKNEDIPPATPPPINAETTPPGPVHGTVAEQPSQDSRDKLAAEAAPAAQPSADDTRSRCKKAIGGKRNREILDLCPDVFARDPRAADIAVALARIEFDRGRSAQAYAWGKRAIAANPDVADAYVFVGGAEQNVGHGKAAKEAYAHYLRLAPSGRYAADLRAIVNSL
jgi:tetratricopeptide (TPR) repeat protein